MSKIFNNWNVEYCRITFLERVLKNHENIINLNRSKDILFTFNRMKQNDSLKVLCLDSYVFGENDLYKVLEDEDIKVNGFFDKEIIQIVGLGITTKTLENTDLKNKGIIVAAQPVRAEIKSKLELYNLKAMLDYIIFA